MESVIKKKFLYHCAIIENKSLNLDSIYPYPWLFIYPGLVGFIFQCCYLNPDKTCQLQMKYLLSVLKKGISYHMVGGSGFVFLHIVSQKIWVGGEWISTLYILNELWKESINELFLKSYNNISLMDLLFPAQKNVEIY